MPASVSAPASAQPVQPPSALAVLASLHRACEQIWPGLQATLAAHPLAQTGVGISLEVLPTLDSTNSELMRRARNRQADATVLVALDQTGGRGRMGKTWHSTPGDSLTFSLGLPMQPRHWGGLSLAVGVSIAESLQRLLGAVVAAPDTADATVQLKWPNDLWLARRKLAGILVETAHAAGQRYVVVGVGINVATVTPPTPSASIEQGAQPNLPVHPPSLPPVPPTGLKEWAPASASLDVGTVLQAVTPALLADLLRFERDGFAPFAQRFAQRDALAGQALVLSDGTHGTGVGIDADGALLVQTATGLRTVNSAEVSVRPQGMVR